MQAQSDAFHSRYLLVLLLVVSTMGTPALAAATQGQNPVLVLVYDFGDSIVVKGTGLNQAALDSIKRVFHERRVREILNSGVLGISSGSGRTSLSKPASDTSSNQDTTVVDRRIAAALGSASYSVYLLSHTDGEERISRVFQRHGFTRPAANHAANEITRTIRSPRARAAAAFIAGGGTVYAAADKVGLNTTAKVLITVAAGLAATALYFELRRRKTLVPGGDANEGGN